MAIVRIPPVLRAQTGGKPEVESGGANVGEVLRALTAAHPDTEVAIGAHMGIDKHVAFNLALALQP